MIHRRELLAGLVGSPLAAGAGCTGRDNGCDDVSITRAETTVRFWCGAGDEATQVDIGGNAENCSKTLTVEAVKDGDVKRSVNVEGGGSWSAPKMGVTIREPALIRVRSPNGDLLAERELSVDHYLDEPDLDVWVRPDGFEDEARVGEPVFVHIGVGNEGAATEYYVSLLVDGEEVERRGGGVREGGECTPSRPEHTFLPEFDEPGAYDLAVYVEAAGSEEDTARTSVGTVTVTAE